VADEDHGEDEPARRSFSSSGGDGVTARPGQTRLVGDDEGRFERPGPPNARGLRAALAAGKARGDSDPAKSGGRRRDRGARARSR